MATTDKVVNFERKMLVPRSRWNDNFLTYLRQEIEGVTKAVFFTGGVIEDDTIGITSSVNDTFTLDITNASRVADGLGHVMDLSKLASSLITDYPFANTNLATYFVGIRFASVADTVERNPRTAAPQYVLTEDSIGELGDPDSVADNTTFIRLVIDGLLEASVDHSGRPVKVFLKTPVSPTGSIAFFSGAIAFTGGLNVIDIPYTAAQGPLGQTTPTFPISLDATKYTVHVQGPSWFEDTDLRNDPTNYAFLGIITGNGPAATPTAFDVSDQNTVFLLSLDKAYRAGTTATPAPGRSILVDKSAVLLRQSATSQRQQDPANTPFLIDKVGETIDFGSVKQGRTPWDTRTLGTMDLQTLADAVSGGDLQPSEVAAITVGNEIDFTRPADFTDLDLLAHMPLAHVLVSLSGSSLGNNGLYLQSGFGFGGNTLIVTNLDGTAANLTIESGLTAVVYVVTHRRKTAPDWQALTFDGTDHTWEHSFPITARGGRMRMLGRQLALTEANVNSFLQFSIHNDDAENLWMRWLPGQLQMRGGGNLNRTNKIFSEGDDRITGHAFFQVDKRDQFGLDAAFQAEETDDEWGYDYRGSDFGKDITSDEAGLQLSAACRHPWTDHDGGAQNIHAVEPFTQASGATITLTRIGVDVVNIPADATNLANFVLVELEYSTPTAADGVYWVSAKSGTNVLALKKLDGGNPTITVGSGNVRLYAGSFFGPLPIGRGAAGTRLGWIHSLVQPATLGGGLLHMAHRYPDRVSSDYHLVSATGPDDADITFALRGSVTFAKSLTTNILNTPSQDDSIRTARTESTEIPLSNSVWELLFPDTLSNADVIRRSSGGTWTVTRVLNRFRGQAFSNQAGGAFSVGEATWGPDDTVDPLFGNQHRSQPSTAVLNIYYFPLTLPQGATLTVLEIRVIPVLGTGGATSLGVDIRRKQWDLTTSVQLLSTGVVRASGGSATLQTVTYTANQNNVIDNTLQEYYIVIEGSTSGSDDQLFGARVTFTVQVLGQSLFDIV